METARIAEELDELPLPFMFDIQPFESIKLEALREHIQRVGIEIYRNPPCAPSS